MYSKTSWATGDKITEGKLNNLEGGVELNSLAIEELRHQEQAPSSLIVEEVSEDGLDKLNKTWQEIWDSAEAGIPVFVKEHGESFMEFFPLTSISFENELYFVYFSGGLPTYYSEDPESDLIIYKEPV